MNDLQLSINGAMTSASAVTDDLLRAVLISLFTWRRAGKDDPTEGQRMGWWGDAYATVSDDRIGSLLWLLARSKLSNDTANRAHEYAQQALQWMIDDGVAMRIDVVTERTDAAGLAISLDIYRNDGSVMPVRFDNLWGTLNV